MRLSAYIPCFNNEATIGRAVDAIRKQTMPIDDIVVVDDGSTDGSIAAAEAAGARVARLPGNLGRGAANAHGIEQASGALTISCGATNVLAPDFAERALPWFDDPRVAVVCGRIDDPNPKGVAGRWRARHLFRTEAVLGVARNATLVSGACILRKAAVLEVGNFDAALVHTEDAELGRRLMAHGYDVVFDPGLRTLSAVQNSVAQVLERYWRWNAGVDEPLSCRTYVKQMAFSVKVMARQDLAATDPAAVPLSLIAPHYQFWRTVSRRLLRQSQSRFHVEAVSDQ
jgi:cellulose synthase/poly-beta-1,6-N-acetylglucosamine synthase-like glycosyltransferase